MSAEKSPLAKWKPEGMTDEEFEAAIAKAEKEADERPPMTPEEEADLQHAMRTNLRVIWREIDGKQRRATTFLPIDRSRLQPDFLRALDAARMTVIIRGFEEVLPDA